MNRTGYMAAVLLAVAFSLTACKGGGDKTLKESKLEYSPEVNAVEVITLKKTDFPRQLLSNGKLSATSRAVLIFGTSGAIKELNAVNGQRVKAGQVIARLDRPDLKLALESARISMEKARLDFYDVLVGQGYTARDTSSVPADVLEMAKMRSGYVAAANSLSRAQYDYSLTVLRAPFSGRVADLEVKLHDQAPAEAFCTILDDSTFDVDFTVMESEYPFIERGLAVKVVPFADAAQTFTGRITSINPTVDKDGQIAVRASVKGADALVDGMNVKVTVEKTVSDQLVVPRSAVVIRDGLDVLFTYQPNGTARWVYVNVISSNRNSFVVEGNSDRGAQLSEGEKVIISSNLNLADGSQVCIKE